jgi:predicted nucleic acid-binding protein
VARYYADSSALVKRHAQETGSAWIKTLTDPIAGHIFITSRIGMVEVLSALNRKRREGNLAAVAYIPIAVHVTTVFATEYQLVEVTADVIDRASTLVEHHPLKGYDAIHLASALLTDAALQAIGLAPLTFLSADTKLLTAATAEGLSIENPDNYP